MKVPTFAELQERLEKALCAEKYDDRHACSWQGYLAALLEWGLIDPDEHLRLAQMVPTDEPNPTGRIPKFSGNLQIFSYEESDADTGERWRTINLHGDPQALRSLGQLLIAVADVDQSKLPLPTGARQHVHIDPGWELSMDSDRLILGRLDAKGSGDFPSNYVPSSRVGKRPIS